MTETLGCKYKNLLNFVNKKQEFFTKLLHQQLNLVAKRVAKRRVAPFRLCLLCSG